MYVSVQSIHPLLISMEDENLPGAVLGKPRDPTVPVGNGTLEELDEADTEEEAAVPEGPTAAEVFKTGEVYESIGAGTVTVMTDWLDADDVEADFDELLWGTGDLSVEDEDSSE